MPGLRVAYQLNVVPMPEELDCMNIVELQQVTQLVSLGRSVGRVYGFLPQLSAEAC